MRTARRGLLRCAPIALLVLGPGLARADGFDAERFVPAVGGTSDLAVESPVVPYHLAISAGLLVNLADDPVIVRDTATDEILARPLDHAVTADLMLSLGLWRFAELGVHLPVQLVYEGDDYVSGPVVLAAAGGVGDLRVVPRVELWGGGDADSHVVLGLVAPVSLPTGDAEALRGAGGVTVEPRLALLAQLGRVGLGANLGYRWRAEKPAALPIGDEIVLALSGAFAFTDSLELHAELLGGQHVGADGDEPDLAVEALAGLIYHASDRWRLYAAAGPGIARGLGTPDVRALVGVRFTSGAPGRNGFADSDGDGVIDRDDECPTEAEDEDAFLDEDGCPDPDNDEDGIADEVDECPDLPEEAGGDGDGCPARTYVEIEDGEITIVGKIRFRTGSAELTAESDSLLDQIAVALKGHPELARVEVAGHTDSTGSAEINQKLSEERAASVKRALVERGVDEDKLVARGYGQSRPVAPNKTAAGRAKNRRVEFLRVD